MLLSRHSGDCGPVAGREPRRIVALALSCLPKRQRPPRGEEALDRSLGRRSEPSILLRKWPSTLAVRTLSDSWPTLTTWSLRTLSRSEARPTELPQRRYWTSRGRRPSCVRPLVSNTHWLPLLHSDSILLRRSSRGRRWASRSRSPAADAGVASEMLARSRGFRGRSTRGWPPSTLQ